MIRAVVDLNVIISALIAPRGTPYEVWSAWRFGRFTLLISEGMILELAGKLAEPKIAERYGISSEDIILTTALLRSQGSLIAVSESQVSTVTGDPEDDLVLATASVGSADYLVTGDKKLLERGEHEGVAIISAREFVSLLTEEK